jgi:hypothetical protein
MHLLGNNSLFMRSDCLEEYGGGGATFYILYFYFFLYNILFIVIEQMWIEHHVAVVSWSCYVVCNSQISSIMLRFKFSNGIFA